MLLTTIILISITLSCYQIVFIHNFKNKEYGSWSTYASWILGQKYYDTYYKQLIATTQNKTIARQTITKDIFWNTAPIFQSILIGYLCITNMLHYGNFLPTLLLSIVLFSSAIFITILRKRSCIENNIEKDTKTMHYYILYINIINIAICIISIC